jgi:hypothetical protein
MASQVGWNGTFVTILFVLIGATKKGAPTRHIYFSKVSLGLIDYQNFFTLYFSDAKLF